MLHVLSGEGGAVSRLSTNDAVLDRDDGTLSYRATDGTIAETAGPEMTSGYGEVVLFVIFDGTSDPSSVTVVKNTTEVADDLWTVERSTTGVFTFPDVSLEAGQWTFAYQTRHDLADYQFAAKQADEPAGVWVPGFKVTSFADAAADPTANVVALIHIVVSPVITPWW